MSFLLYSASKPVVGLLSVAVLGLAPVRMKQMDLEAAEARIDGIERKAAEADAPPAKKAPAPKEEDR